MLAAQAGLVLAIGLLKAGYSQGYRSINEGAEMAIRSKLTRRSVMAATAAAAGSVVTQAFAQSTQGPKVWLEMDQSALDDAYDQFKYAPNWEQMLKRYETTSESTRQHLGAPKRLTYGSTPVEGIDLFSTQATNAPMNIFIHGGAWIIEEAKNFAFPAEMFNRAGAHYLAVDFTNVRETKGDLMPLAQQVRSAIAWIYKNAASFGGDPNRIYISGHSSGGHLASVAFTTDWTKDFGLPADVIKGGLFVSGMYDLKPVRLSSRSKYVVFTDAVEQALSPQRHLDHIVAPMIIAYGTQENP
jgi:arylformamidase